MGRRLFPLLLFLGSAWAVEGDDLGRLFSSPEQRRASAERAPVARLDGVLLRPDGERVVWIDGRRVGVGGRLEGVGRVVRVEGARVVVERRGRRLGARVGEPFEVLQ